jgi:hypothetical protein
MLARLPIPILNLAPRLHIVIRFVSELIVWVPLASNLTRTTLTATRLRSTMQHGYGFGCEPGRGAIETCAILVQSGCVRTAV